MAVGAWVIVKRFKRNLGRGTIAFQTAQCRMALFNSAGSANISAAIASLSSYGSLNSGGHQISAVHNYSTGGGTRGKCSGTWTATGTASAGQSRFSYATARVWTAGGGNIANVKYAVLYLSGASSHVSPLICISKLSTSQFTIATGNTLTITPAATGVFNLA